MRAEAGVLMAGPDAGCGGGRGRGSHGSPIRLLWGGEVVVLMAIPDAGCGWGEAGVLMPIPDAGCAEGEAGVLPDAICEGAGGVLMAISDASFVG